MAPMRIFTQYTGLPAEAKGAVAAIGNFDGVHPGHRAVLGRAWDVAETLGAPLGLITFEPHPRRYFQPAIPPFRLTPAPAKRRLIAACAASVAADDHVHPREAELFRVVSDWLGAPVPPLLPGQLLA